MLWNGFVIDNGVAGGLEGGEGVSGGVEDDGRIAGLDDGTDGGT